MNIIKPEMLESTASFGNDKNLFWDELNPAQERSINALDAIQISNLRGASRSVLQKNKDIMKEQI